MMNVKRAEGGISISQNGTEIVLDPVEISFLQESIKDFFVMETKKDCVYFVSQGESICGWCDWFKNKCLGSGINSCFEYKKKE